MAGGHACGRASLAGLARAGFIGARHLRPAACAKLTRARCRLTRGRHLASIAIASKRDRIPLGIAAVAVASSSDRIPPRDPVRQRLMQMDPLRLCLLWRRAQGYRRE